jgi:hypothetical protein
LAARDKPDLLSTWQMAANGKQAHYAEFWLPTKPNDRTTIIHNVFHLVFLQEPEIELKNKLQYFALCYIQSQCFSNNS